MCSCQNNIFLSDNKLISEISNLSLDINLYPKVNNYNMILYKILNQYLFIYLLNTSKINS